MKKIDIGTYMSSTASGTPSKLLGIDSSNNACVSIPAGILKAAGNTVGYLTDLTSTCYGDKWYRIASGLTISQTNSVLLNISHRFNNLPHEANLFFILACGSGGKRAMRLDNDGAPPFVKKIRIVYNGTEEPPLVDVMFNFGEGIRNTMYLSYACNIGFTFQMPVEVPETPDEGYSVKEFTFE